jgi:hypothetical protein
MTAAKQSATVIKTPATTAMKSVHDNQPASSLLCALEDKEGTVSTGTLYDRVTGGLVPLELTAVMINKYSSSDFKPFILKTGVGECCTEASIRECLCLDSLTSSVNV